jgi:hypothetical protein
MSEGKLTPEKICVQFSIFAARRDITFDGITIPSPPLNEDVLGIEDATVDVRVVAIGKEIAEHIRIEKRVVVPQEVPLAIRLPEVEVAQCVEVAVLDIVPLVVPLGADHVVRKRRTLVEMDIDVVRAVQDLFDGGVPHLIGIHVDKGNKGEPGG